MAFPTGWGRKQKITIDNTKVGATLSNFPMLITLDHLNSEVVDAGSNSALNGGGDIRFSSDSAGTTQLACEVVSFVTNATPASRECEIWVKVPSVSGSVDTDIYIWYNKAGETQPAVTDTYGRNAVWSDYATVLHLDSTTVTDSTGNHTPSLTGTPSVVSGQWGNALDFSGTEYITVADSTELDSATGVGQARTTQFWGAFTTTSNTVILEKGANFNWVFQTNLSRFIYRDGDNISSTVNSQSTGTNNSGNWFSVHGVSDADESYQIYVDATAGNDITTESHRADSNDDLVIGSRSGSFGYTGNLSEVRVRNEALASTWISTEYENQNAPATFATAGTPEAVGAVAITRQPYGRLAYGEAPYGGGTGEAAGGGTTVTGTGALASQSATMSGTAERELTGTGALVAQSATMSGTAERELTSTGALASQSSTMAGTGTVSAGLIASGSLQAQSSTMSGTAEREVTGTGSLSAQSSTVSGTANVLQTITGSGALASQSATMTGVASGAALEADGALQAQSASMSGTATTVPDFIVGGSRFIIGHKGQYYSEVS